MHTESFWEATYPDRPRFPTIKSDLDVDVAIIGGGITGITAANELTNAGLKVGVFDARRIGGGTTGWSTGNLYVPVGYYYQKIKEARNAEVMKTVAHSRAVALDYIEKNNISLQLDSFFTRRPWFFFTSEGENIKLIQREAECLKEAGFETTEINQVPYLNIKSKFAIRLDHHAARFHPLRYVIHLAENLSQRGCQIFEYSTATSIDEKEDNVQLKVGGFNVNAKYVIYASHIPIGFHPVQTVSAPYRSYVVSAKLQGDFYPDAYYWHPDGGHHAITTHGSFSPELNIMMVAGSHHKTGQAKEQDYIQYFQNLKSYFSEVAEVSNFQEEWSAQHYRSGDGVPYIGPSLGKRKFIATSYYADGLTYGTVAGILISDIIRGIENPWEKVYHSGRINLTTIENFLKENVNVAGEYIKEIPFRGDVDQLNEIKAGEGKTIECDGQKIAAFRHEDGILELVSAVCTHLKCIVNWNNAEKTWDCPCHGSRFMTDGTVIEGPAIFNLQKVNIKS
jgi:glycine/D-amino acid oxidase-like deaminating enzyme/nitrite reductase/ring-hydroxylating ferredoxin subunit